MEEEAGFTFVDKRRVSVEETTAAVPEPDPILNTDALDDPEDMAEGLNVYALLSEIVNFLASSAWQNLGLIPVHPNGQVNQDLAQAKVAIDAVGDLVARLESAPDSAVSSTNRRELRNLLNNLRLNYVGQRDRSASDLSVE